MDLGLAGALWGLRLGEYEKCRKAAEACMCHQLGLWEPIHSVAVC